MRAAFPLRLALVPALAAACAVIGGAREVTAQAGLRERTIFVSARTERITAKTDFRCTGSL